MFLFVMFIFLTAAGVGLILYGARSTYGKLGWMIGGAAAIVIGVVLLFFSTFYQNGQGEAKVVINGVDRTYIKTIDNPSAGFKAPWDDFIDFDLFAQQLVYAGNNGQAPAYTGGKVQGAEVTVTTGGTAGGSTQGWVDITVDYNIDGSKLRGIYEEFRSQERFTQMKIEKQALEIIRQVPTAYTAIEFRGIKKPEAAKSIAEQLNARLLQYGVTVTGVTIQDVRYSAHVEGSLTELEVAVQNKQRAQLEADAAFTRAKGEAAAKIEAARGEATSNGLLDKSLTDKVLQARYIEAIKAAAAAGNVVITDGKTDVLVNK